jgi:BASS family bile acid:Na+ symporter
LLVLVAVVLAFPLQSLAWTLKPLIPGFLFVLMLFASAGFDPEELRRVAEFKRQVGACLLVNYGLLTGFLVAAAFLFFGEIRNGNLVIAAMPPAIAVVALVSLTDKENLPMALVSEILTYVAALGLAPLILLSFATKVFNPLFLLQILFFFILLPLFASQLLRKVEFLVKEKELLSTSAFSLITFTVVGINVSFLLEGKPSMLALLTLIHAVKTFGLGFLLLKLTGNRTYAFFASFKNMGAAAAVSLLLFSDLASLPVAVGIILESFLIAYSLSYWKPGKPSGGVRG